MSWWSFDTKAVFSAKHGKLASGFGFGSGRGAPRAKEARIRTVKIDCIMMAD